MERLNTKLDTMVASGELAGWELEFVDEDGHVGRKSRFRNTEKLTLVFSSGMKLVLGTICSGCAENTCFVEDGDE